MKRVVSTRLGRISKKLRAELDRALEAFAEEAEEYTRAHRNWVDDSGSAAASITGYLVGKGDWQKNFNRPAWVAARQPGYRSPRWGHGPENFRPFVVEDEVTGDPQVILTMFVKYGEALEWNPLAGMTFYSAMQALRNRFFNVVAEATKRGISV